MNFFIPIKVKLIEEIMRSWFLRIPRFESTEKKLGFFYVKEDFLLMIKVLEWDEILRWD